MKTATALTVACALLFAACGTPGITTIETTDITPEVGQAVAAGVESATPSKSEKMAAHYATIAPGAIRSFCKSTDVLGRERMYKIMYEEMGAMVIHQGGKPSEVFELLLEDC